MRCDTYPLGSLDELKYVVVLSRMDGRILLSRHRERSGWETQGGHIEPGETPLAAARRELYEESGALEYSIAPLCDYQFAHGAAAVYAVSVTRLGPLPESEMAEVRLFDEMPRELTYPEAGPELYDYALRMKVFEAL